jgi:predicted ATPase
MSKNSILSLKIQNLLSFGEESPEIVLGALNVLVGPNGSGKSNLIEVLNLIRNTPKDFAGEIGDGGGIAEFLWQSKSKVKDLLANITVTSLPAGVLRPLQYSLTFTRSSAHVKIADERIENRHPDKGHDKPYLYFDFNHGRPVLNVAGSPRSLKREEVDPQRSILSQRQDPDQYPEVTYLGKFFASFRLYRNWDFGPDSLVRDLYSASQKNDYLEEDIGNLGLMLNRLRALPETSTSLLEYLRLFYSGAEDVLTPVQGGLIDLRIQESGGISIAASRLSDGTLRWLSLLTILLNPEPPPVVCIEEPELGLHPDMIGPLADLLRAAAERMQLIVTTHSADLIDALSDTPEAVIVCDKINGSTSLRRLEKEELSSWLNNYTLGQLWRTGELGGNRW